MHKSASISECEQYRYLLTRTWDESLGIVNFIGVNPSTADATEDDATIRKCVNYALNWGYGGLAMTNLFAYRSRDPAKLPLHHNPIGDKNDLYLRETATKSSLIILAWGTNGALEARDRGVIDMLQHHDLYCLKKTKDGFPNHPLYLKANLKPLPYNF